MVLPQFGVIALEIRTLKKGHTEKWRAQKHSWCVEHQRIFACFINALVYFIPKQWYAKFIKNVYNQSYQQYVHYASVALCAFGTSVFSLSLSAFYMQQAYFITLYFGRSVFIHVLDDRFWSWMKVEWGVGGLNFVYISSSVVA